MNQSDKRPQKYQDEVLDFGGFRWFKCIRVLPNPSFKVFISLTLYKKRMPVMFFKDSLRLISQTILLVQNM